MDNAQYRIDLLQNRIAELEQFGGALRGRIRDLEQWQEKAREDIARMEQAIVALAEPRSTPRDMGELAAMHGLVHVR